MKRQQQKMPTMTIRPHRQANETKHTGIRCVEKKRKVYSILHGLDVYLHGTISHASSSEYIFRFSFQLLSKQIRETISRNEFGG